MRKIILNANDAGQRADRFLKKYLSGASAGDIYKNLRKKNIKRNNKRLKPEDILMENDEITLYLSDELLDKFIIDKKRIKNVKRPRIIYEDENIILMDKFAGILSHNDSPKYTDNYLDRMVDYLIEKGEYEPRLEKSFRPALCNRLDRNTSGILIGAKNSNALKQINQAIKDRKLKKLYLALVKGKAGDFSIRAKLKKVDEKVYRDEGGKESLTVFRSLISNDKYSLLMADLITGRTHQIRISLKEADHPLLGDIKYGDPSENKKFLNRYNYSSQFLHNYKIRFDGLGSGLEYLNGRSFFLPPAKVEDRILKDIFGDEYIKALL